MNHLRRSSWLRLWLAVWVVVGGTMAAGWRSEALGTPACAAEGGARALFVDAGTVAELGPGPIVLSNVVGWVEEARSPGDLGEGGGGFSLLAGCPVPRYVVWSQKPSHPEVWGSSARLHVLCVYRL